MAANHSADYFLKEFERINNETAKPFELIEEHILEIKEILNGMNKGLKIIQSMGKKPEEKVLQNHLLFQDLLKKYESLL